MAVDIAEIDDVIYKQALNYARQNAWWSIATRDKLACDISMMNIGTVHHISLFCNPFLSRRTFSSLKYFAVEVSRSHLSNRTSCLNMLLSRDEFIKF